MHYLSSTLLAIAAISLPATMGAPRPDTATTQSVPVVPEVLATLTPSPRQMTWQALRRWGITPFRGPLVVSHSQIHHTFYVYRIHSRIAFHTSNLSLSSVPNDGYELTLPPYPDGQLTQQSSYTVGISLGLDFEDIAEAGDLSGSVSYTTETSTTQGVTDTCPQGAWYCALSITPTMVKVSGVATQNAKCGLQGLSSPYTILMPKLGGDGNPVINAEACTCDNLPDWSDPGHIGLLCPGACALPGSS